jgi:hypothetical protein
MTITQAVEIPANHRLTIDVPREVPEGRAILVFAPTNEQAAAPKRKPVPQFFNILSPNTYGDGVAYQRKIRDEWDA